MPERDGPLWSDRPGRKGHRMSEELGTIEIVRDPAGRIESPCGIFAAGDDVWFTSIANDRVGRVRAAGPAPVSVPAVETFADPRGRMRLPANLTPAADGRIWITCLGSDRLAALDPDAADPTSAISTVTHPDLRGPVAIKSSPGGLLWCTVRGSNAIASLDPRAADPSASIALVRSGLIADPSALFVDPRGLVWWVNAATATIGRLDPAAPEPAATVARFGPWPEYGAPRAWAPGPADELWVTTQGSPGLLIIVPARSADADAAAQSARSGDPPGDPAVRWRTDARLRTPDGVWLADDGAVWIADTAADAIVRFAPDIGRWDSFTAPGVEGPFDIKPGPDPSYMWFTNKRGDSLGRIRVAKT